MGSKISPRPERADERAVPGHDFHGREETMHFARPFTMSGPVCGTISVWGVTTIAEHVNCRRCLAWLDRHLKALEGDDG